MEETKKPLKLLKKLHNIMVAIESIPKNGYNSAQSYHYATEADVLEAFRKELIKEQVFITSSLESVESKPEGYGVLTTVTMSYIIYDLDSDESLPLIFAGQGMDKGDKGIYKAYTGSNKYFLLKTFWLPTYEDPENDGGHKGTKKATGKTSAPKTTSYADRPKTGKGSKRMRSKYGSQSSPNKCNFCGERHIVEGEEIVCVDNVWGKEACFERAQESSP